uniref:sphingolipid 4-desaturase n=1 Tax=Brachionus rotundiformis TaxID=96890 RepID=A0A482G9H9_9BILA|nr:fatty acid desaturase 4-2 [Brachionus rotundiformis]
MIKELQDLFKSDKNDFFWEATDEPHASRRKQILAKYPQIKKLMGHDPRIAVQLVIMVLIQLCVTYLVRNMSWMEIVLLSYVVGGTLNHSLSLGLHEVAHNLAFGAHRPIANRLIGFFANLPLGFPASITFRKYHLDHHKYQGDELIDVDLPTRIEGVLFSSFVGKFVFIVLQPLFYCLRPVIVLPKTVTFLEILNWTIQIAFDSVILYFLGIKSLVYLWLGTLLGLGLHPIAGHFIAEHYVFVKGFETYSYYGPLNLITFNVGYHNEHHDFPNIPGYRLPEVKKMAPEFYDNLPCHHSWIKVLYDFITCTEMGPYARVKRKTKYTREWAQTSDRQSMVESKAQ